MWKPRPPPRTRRSSAPAPPDRGRVRQHGRVAALAPGDGVLYESQQAFELGFPTDMMGYTLIFPRSLLKMRSSVITDRCGHTIGRNLSSARLLAGYLGQLVKLAD